MDWLLPFVTMDISLAEKALRTGVVYLGIVVLLRLAGKRLLAEMNSLDLVVVLLLSNVVQNAIIGPDNSVLGAMVGAVVLIGADLALDLATQRFSWLQRLLVGSPTLLVADGRSKPGALARVGIEPREFALALRRRGIDDPAMVEEASLEPGGDLLITVRPEDQPVTRRDLDEAMAELRELLSQAR